MTSPADSAKAPGNAILIVEDDRDIAETLAEILEYNGYEALTAGNGKEALDKLRQGDRLPRLILLDLMMPVMDGWQFREAQSGDPALASVPVIIVSAHVRAREAAVQLGAVGWLKKPVDLDTLLRAVADHWPVAAG